jgi:DNA polymerase-1
MTVSFKQMTTAEPNTVMVVDALNLAFRYKHSKAKSFVDDYLHTVDSLKKSYKAAKVIITCDAGSSSYRKNLFPEYKQNRKDKQETQTEQERAEFEVFFEEFMRVMDVYAEGHDYPLLRFDKCEADDIAAYIVNKRRKKNKIWLISSDKDWDLLISESVSRFSYVTRKQITYDNWHEHYDYSIDDHISIKCLTGDTGDNIPGVSGIGPKKAFALVQEFGSTYDIIASLPISSKYKHIANLNDFGAEALLLNYRLMDLQSNCAEALGEENCATIDKVLKEYLDGNN